MDFQIHDLFFFLAVVSVVNSWGFFVTPCEFVFLAFSYERSNKIPLKESPRLVFHEIQATRFFFPFVLLSVFFFFLFFYVDLSIISVGFQHLYSSDLMLFVRKIEEKKGWIFLRLSEVPKKCWNSMKMWIYKA